MAIDTWPTRRDFDLTISAYVQIIVIQMVSLQRNQLLIVRRFLYLHHMVKYFALQKDKTHLTNLAIQNNKLINWFQNVFSL